ncbi:UDP-N-acetylmuramate dehydrogenase [Magnetococcales bacterium HHB-1]
MTDLAQGIPIQHNIPLAPKTTFRLGGPARHYATPQTTDDLCSLLKKKHHHTPQFILGGGSNLLVEDEGFEGLIIDLRKSGQALRCTPWEVWHQNRNQPPPAPENPDKKEHNTTLKREISDQGAILEAHAGVRNAKLAHFARQNKLCGAEFLAGIPGTLGGALRMNAGAFGREIKDILYQVELFDRQQQKRHILNKDDLKMSYRTCQRCHNAVILRAWFHLFGGHPETIRQRMRQHHRTRITRQPLEHFSAGSTFKNPSVETPAWRLIEASGLRGKSVGDAQVSKKHCNFLINLGQAKGSDMLKLINHVQERVLQRTGIELALEIKILGPKGERETT